MDLFSFLILLIMATFTLSSAGLLLSLVVMERKPDRSGTLARKPPQGRRGGKGKRTRR
jgi:hypothetical protein